ncbi:porin family protein [Nitrospinae bacterium AH_259_B05_G02_I21]|nr:porin family protein [Nitrospinae bacterium AH_259_B05_G02_I21]MDA2932113.1 porin family protein [Nitrospinae bacterium AH-259-F20]
MRSLLFMGAIGILVLGLAVGVSAEPYAAGYVGGALPFDQDTFSENPLDITITDFKPEDSVVFGAKGGYWFDNFPYIGIEGNVQAWFPDIDDQNVVVTKLVGSGSESASNKRFAAEVDAISMAVVLLGRYPIEHSIGTFVPYAGGGIGWTHVDFSRAQFDSLDVRADDDLFPHVQVQGGLKYFFPNIPNLGLFVEYMYQKKHFDTTIGLDGSDPNDLVTIEVDFENQFIQGGVEWRFWDPFAQ